MATGKEIGRLEGHGSCVSSLVFWPDGKKLASSSADQTIRIWDVASRKCLDVLRGHRQEVWRLALLPDDKTLVSGCKDGTVCFWDTSVTHPRQPRITFRRTSYDWCFAPDSRSVLTLNHQGQVSRWTGTDFQQKEPLLEIGTQFLFVDSFSLDGRFLAVGSTNGVLQIWDLSRRVLSHQLTNTTGKVWAIKFSRRRKQADNLLRERQFASRMGSHDGFGNSVVAGTGAIFRRVWLYRPTSDRA